MNLLEHPWLPVRRRSGAVERIVPSQLTEGLDSDPFVALATGRPDFDGALLEFLIGLLQTTLAPPDEKAWRSLWRKPPSPDALASAFAPYRDAFELDGEGPRFMQDLELEAAAPGSADAWLIRDLVVGDHKEHFGRKPRRLCGGCITAALYLVQTNSAGGGRGHMSSPRGGGRPLTLVQVNVLWYMTWFAVLPWDRFPMYPFEEPRPRHDDVIA